MVTRQVKRRAQTRSGPADCPKVDTVRGTKKKDSAMWSQVLPVLGSLLDRERGKGWY